MGKLKSIKATKSKSKEPIIQKSNKETEDIIDTGIKTSNQGRSSKTPVK